MIDQVMMIGDLKGRFLSLNIHTDPLSENSFQEEWSELPYDLLELILERLSLQESILFGGVCKSWHETFTHYKPPSDQHPYFSTLSYGLISHFFNVRTYDEESSPSPSLSSPLPDITEKHDDLCDASHGWLLMKPYRTSTIYLFNPFVKDDGSLIVIPNCPIKQYKYAFLLQPPNEFLVMVDSGDREIYYVRGGSSSGWCELLRPPYIATHFERVVPASSAIGTKHDIYYGIDEYGRLFVIDLHHRSITCLEELPLLNSCCRINLVGYAGEVFAVLKYGNIRRSNNGGGDDDEVGIIEGFNYRLSDHQCIKFKVFRLDLKSLAWVRVDDLGEHVIYVSGLCCAMVRACRGDQEGGNRIYFIDRYVKCNAEWYVFNMKDWSTKRGPPKLNSNKDNEDDRMKNWFWFSPNHEISRATVQEEVESSSVLPPPPPESDHSEANKGDGDQLMRKPIIDSKKGKSKKGKLQGKSRNDELNLQQQQQQPNSKRGGKSRKGKPHPNSKEGRRRRFQIKNTPN